MEKEAFLAGFYSSFEKTASVADIIRAAQAARRTQQRVGRFVSNVKDVGKKVGQKIGPPLATAGRALDKASIKAESGLRRASRLSAGSGDLFIGLKKILPPSIYTAVTSAVPKNLDDILKQFGSGAGEAAGGIAGTRSGIKKIIASIRNRRT